MRSSERGALPKDLFRGQSRFEAWRQRRRPGQRIPPSLWALAVRLVGSYGVSRTPAALRLDYYGLKRRAQEAGEPPAPGNRAFVELPPLAVGKQALFERPDSAGAARRLQLVGYDADEVAVLARCFWSVD
jgi:hypothetical protein